METPKRKFPLFLIGLISCFAIAVAGIVVDFIMDSEGKVAIISVVAAFLVCAVFLIIDVIVRRVAEKKAAKEAISGPPQFSVPADQRFLRHSDTSDQPDFTPAESFGGFADDGFDDGFSGGYEEEDPLARMERESPSMVLRRRAAELRAAQEGEESTDDAFGGFDAPAYAPADTFAPAYAPAEQFAPAQEEMPAEDDGYAGDYDDTYGDYAADDYADDLAEDFSEEPQYEPQPAEQFLEPERSYVPQPVPAPVPQPQPAPQPVPAAPERTAAMSAGQTLESFYEDMSEEDILYRDCVEVWAADAKPCVLRLMKLVEELEDKKAQVRFGRELEYVNAMIDRIYCFTQLEYVDELLELEEHNFAALVKECLKRFSPFFMEKKLGLLWKGLDVNVMTDKKWFIFALTQVIFNSVEFTPEGGKIAISAKKNGEYIDLMIDDSGKGVAPDELPCVFIAGYMGDESPNEAGRRTGMGLFIAQSVLRKMGGDAFMESNYGKGARVTLRVPAIKPPEK